MRERGLQIALMCLGVAVVAYAGCSDGGTTSGTTTGDATTTSGSSGSTTSGSAASTTASSGSGSTSTGGSSDSLGLACTSDADCGASKLKCLTADVVNPAFGGGPANGYCSKDCMTDDDCPGLSSLCAGATAGQAGVCLLTCDIGPALASLDEMLDATKCQGREDLRCTSVSTAATACLPTCGKDDQCPAGKVCDPRSTVCVEKANTGLAPGAKCDPKATTPECGGLCVSFTDVDASWCSSACGLGGDFTDLTTIADCGGVDKGMCYYFPTGHGAGDSGFCVPACKKQDECQNPSFWCSDVGLPDNGYCTIGTPCPNGQADCKVAADKCTQTKYGPICLDPKYPLGTAAPMGTTSSSSGSSGSGSSGSGSSGSGAGGAGSSSSASGTGGATSGTTTATATSGTGP